MCGIHFVINADKGNSAYGLDDFMSDAFIANQVRGTDSSGMFQVKRYNNSAGKPEVQFQKQAVCGTDFVGDPTVRTMLTASRNSRVTVGHVRAATQGVISQANAHPFTVKRTDGSRLIGVHNGTLRNWRAKEGSESHAVDSDWLLTKLAEDGADAFQGFEGAWALVWYDSDHPETLFIARNEHRPLFYAKSEDGKAMIAASELGMLGWLADRNKIKLGKNEKGITFFYPPAGSIMEVDINTLETKLYPYAEYKSSAYSRPVVVTHTATTSKHSHTPSVSFNWQDSVLTRVKDALAVGVKRATSTEEEEGTAPFGPDPTTGTTDSSSTINDEAGFEAAVQAEVKRFTSERKDSLSEDDDGPGFGWKTNRGPKGTNLGYIEKPLARRACSAEERRRAKLSGMFGLVVEYSGYWFDEDDKSVYGDFNMEINGIIDSYDSIVRGQSRAAGESKYVDIGPSTRRMVVVGMTAPHKFNGNKPYYVLADIAADDKIREFDMSPKRSVN